MAPKDVLPYTLERTVTTLRQRQPRVYRPYIPLAVRVQVAARQLRDDGWASFGGKVPLWLDDYTLSDKYRLHVLLNHLFGIQPVHLDHDPALVNRRWNNRTKDYEPRANDPAHLVYRTKVDHDIKTRVRGIGAQHSDLGQRRKNKALARNREKRTGRASDSHAKLRRPKRKWPSRPWPKRTMR